MKVAAARMRVSICGGGGGEQVMQSICMGLAGRDSDTEYGPLNHHRLGTRRGRRLMIVQGLASRLGSRDAQGVRGEARSLPLVVDSSECAACPASSVGGPWGGRALEALRAPYLPLPPWRQRACGTLLLRLQLALLLLLRIMEVCQHLPAQRSLATSGERSGGGIGRDDEEGDACYKHQASPAR